jgi:hypothetical protein
VLWFENEKENKDLHLAKISTSASTAERCMESNPTSLAMCATAIMDTWRANWSPAEDKDAVFGAFAAVAAVLFVLKTEAEDEAAACAFAFGAFGAFVAVADAFVVSVYICICFCLLLFFPESKRPLICFMYRRRVRFTENVLYSVLVFNVGLILRFLHGIERLSLGAVV